MGVNLYTFVFVEVTILPFFFFLLFFFLNNDFMLIYSYMNYFLATHRFHIASYC